MPAIPPFAFFHDGVGGFNSEYTHGEADAGRDRAGGYLLVEKAVESFHAPAGIPGVEPAVQVVEGISEA